MPTSSFTYSINGSTVNFVNISINAKTYLWDLYSSTVVEAIGKVNDGTIEKFGKKFDQLTKETVKAFLIDSKKAKFKI